MKEKLTMRVETLKEASAWDGKAARKAALTPRDEAGVLRPGVMLERGNAGVVGAGGWRLAPTPPGYVRPASEVVEGKETVTELGHAVAAWWKEKFGVCCVFEPPSGEIKEAVKIPKEAEG